MSSVPPTDVIVVGCGVIGAAVSWQLAQLGRSVVCFDPEPGEGATYAAAGMLAAITEADFGEHDLTRMNVASAALWPKFTQDLEAETGLPTGLRQTGTLTVAFDSGDRQELHRLLGLRRSWGLDVHEITVDEARRMEPLLGPRLAGAAWAPDDHQVNPRQVHAALLSALEGRDVPVWRRRVDGLLRSADGSVSGVLDETGRTHEASSVVLAAGWNTPHLVRPHPQIHAPIRPVKGQLVRLDARGRTSFGLRHVIRGFVQGRPIYLVPREDGEVVVGATSEEQPDDRQVTAGGVFAVLRDARALVPGIDELPLKELTARARPASPDNLPMIGDTEVPGLILAAGHYRNGILLAPLTAEAVAARYRGSMVPEVIVAANPRRFAKLDVVAMGEHP